MRAHNERLVLTLLRNRGPLPKAEIARLSGLSAQAASVIMRKLEGEKLLLRDAPVRGRVGQPAVPMRLAERGALFFGLKVGRRSTELVLTDFLGQVIDRRRRVHDYPEPACTVEFAHQSIDALRATLPDDEQARLAGLGIAIPFFLWNWGEAMGVPAARMAVWREADIRTDIAARYAFPVFLENDATSACGAEVVFAPGEAAPDFLYFYVGFFIGGGVVLDGRVFTGRSGNAGALGPMPVSAAPPGQAHVATQLLDAASLVVLERALRQAGHTTTAMWESADNWPDAPEIVNAWLDEAAYALAHGITSAMALVDFAEVRIDGWMPPTMRTSLVDRVQAALSQYDYSGLPKPSIREGTIGPDARALGAASLPLARRYLVD